MESSPTSTSPIRSVLFLTHALNLGGVATHMHALGKGLMKRGVRVGVVARQMDDGKPFGREFFAGAGFDLFQCDFPAYGLSWNNLKKAFRSIRGLRRIARDYQADVLHVHAPTLCLAARATGLPYVTTFNIAVDGRQKIKIARLVNKLCGSAFGQLSFAISQELERNLVDDLGIPARRVKRVIYTIDDSAFAPATPDERRAAREHYDLPQDAVVACMVASLEPRKNHALLLDAMKILKDRRCPLVAILAGSGWGTHEADLHAAIAARGVQATVKYLGQQPAKRVYHASDVFVLPSLKEGFPLSTIEAMLSGLVPIRTPSEGATEQIRDGETGYIVPFGQPEVLADRLERLALPRGESLTQLGAAANEDARARFGAGRMAAEAIELYGLSSSRVMIGGCG
jgi:glycosyltransferase involved in cell wall biosynthesis